MSNSEIQTPKPQFGTDGWRALYPEQINKVSIARVALAFAMYLKEQNLQGEVIIGYDPRMGSGLLAGVFARVLAKAGFRVLLSDSVLPTPAVSFNVMKRKALAGVMITASHNPPSYNGVKFKTASGAPFSTAQTARVEYFLDHSESPDMEHSHDAAGLELSDLKTPYFNHISTLVDWSLIRKGGWAVLSDSMNGAVGDCFQQLCQQSGIKCDTLAPDPRPDFGGRLPEPIAQNLMPLSGGLRMRDYALGLAFDGDGDRFGVMDENGQWVNIQEVIMLLAEYLMLTRDFGNKLVKTASVTEKLSLLTGINGIAADITEVQVGFKYVSEAMEEKRALMGAEESGGFGYAFHMPDRDGMVSALLMLEMLAASGFNKLSSCITGLRKRYGPMHYARIDQPDYRPQRTELLSDLAHGRTGWPGEIACSEMRQYRDARGVINGLKVIIRPREAWVLLRASETEPMLRLYAEGSSESEVQFLLKSSLSLLGLK